MFEWIWRWVRKDRIQFRLNYTLTVFLLIKLTEVDVFNESLNHLFMRLVQTELNCSLYEWPIKPLVYVIRIKTPLCVDQIAYAWIMKSRRVLTHYTIPSRKHTLVMVLIFSIITNTFLLQWNHIWLIHEMASTESRPQNCRDSAVLPEIMGSE